jgi:hypothetical protein
VKAALAFAKKGCHVSNGVHSRTAHPPGIRIELGTCNFLVRQREWKFGEPESTRVGKPLCTMSAKAARSPTRLLERSLLERRLLERSTWRSQQPRRLQELTLRILRDSDSKFDDMPDREGCSVTNSTEARNTRLKEATKLQVQS